jgi:hypothetical protein
MNSAVVVLLGALLVGQDDGARLPMTIQVLRDVPVRESGQYRRGTLITIGDDRDGFVIKKGERFQMTAAWGEGHCHVRYKGKERDIGSCPWLEGFSDHETDVFKVIAPRQAKH